MKVVIDTNIFISALLSGGGPSRQVLRLCLQGRYHPLMGNALLAEYEDVCNRDRLFKAAVLNPLDRNDLLDAFLNCCLWTPIYFLWRPNLRDEADNHIMELAVAGNASVIVTANKRDFLSTQLKFPSIAICDAAEFLKLQEV